MSTNSLANYMRTLREGRNMTIYDVAKAAQCDPSTITKVESSKNVKPRTMRMIAKGLGIAETSPEFETMVALWTVQVGLQNLPKSTAQKLSKISARHSKTVEANARRLANTLGKLKVAEQQALIESLEEPDTRAALIALAQHYNVR